MANQQNSYTGSQGTGTNNADFPFTFPSFTTSEVKVEVDNVVKTLTTHYTVEDYNTTSGGKVRFTSGNIPTGTTPLRIFRQTDVDSAKATFTAGASLKAGEINDNFKQVRHALQEAIGAVTTDRKVQRFNIEADSIDGTLIADEAIDSEHYVDGSIDRVHLEADIIDGSKIEDNAVNHEHIAADAVRTSEIQNSAVTQNKLANNSVGTPEIINGSVNSDKIANGTIVNADISSSAAIDASKIVSATGSVAGTMSAADKAKLDGIDSGAKDDQTAAEIKTLLQSNKITDSEIATGTLDNRYFTETELTGGALDGRYFTETELTGGALDGRYFTETESDARYFNISSGDTIKDGDTFPDNDTTIATTAAINDRILDIVDGVGGFVPLVDEGEIPQYHPEKENNANDRAGTIVSIGTLTTTYTPNNNGIVTIPASDLTNHSVDARITHCGSTVLPSGFGVLVETKTQSDSQYAANPSFKFHRLVPKATEVTTVAGKATEVTTVHTNITNINAVANNATNINAVAADATDIGVVAGKATEIGRLGTADAVADMAILGTADVVSDLNTLGTADVVADMNMLATSDVVADMNMLAVSDVISDMNALATTDNITAMDTCRDNISSINNASTNISSVNNFGDTYQVSANDPTTDGGGNTLAEGDLYFNTSADRLKVYNGSSWVNGVEISGSGAVTTGNTFTGDNRYNDGVKALFGTGSDLEIVHDGNNSVIQNNTGITYIKGLGGSGNTIWLQPKNNESSAKFNPDAGVELFYDHSKKLETVSGGVKSFGDFSFRNNNDQEKIVFDNSADHLKFSDSIKAKFGDGNDLQIYHNGTDSYLQNNTGNLFIRGNGDDIFLKAANTKDSLICRPSGAVELFHNNSKKFETTSNGIDVDGTVTANDIITAGALLHEGDSDTLVHFSADNTIDLKTGGSSRLTVTNNGLALQNGYFTSNGNRIILGDSSGANVNRIIFGNNDDLQIYHDGSHSYITNATSDLRIRSGYLKLQGSNGEDMLIGNQNTSVELYYDNSKKLETASDGILASGAIRTNAATSGAASANQATFDFNSQNARLLSYHSSGSSISAFTNPNGGSLAERFRIEAGGDIKVTGDKAIFFGASDDLMVGHDGTSTRIEDNYGYLTIKSNALELRSNTGSELYIKNTVNGAVELYHDNSKKLETTSTGVSFNDGNITNVGIIALDAIKGDADDNTNITFAGNDVITFKCGNTSPALTVNTTQIKIEDNQKFVAGTGNDLQIYHDGSHSYLANSTGNLYINAPNYVQLGVSNGGEKYLTATENGAVELYHDNIKSLETTATGIEIKKTASNGSAILDIEATNTGQAVINLKTSASSTDRATLIYFHNRDTLQWSISNDYYQNGTNDFGLRHGAENAIRALPDANVELYYDNSKKIETTSGGVYITGAAVFPDGSSNGLQIGNSSDLQIYHDGSNSYIYQAGVGELRTNTTTFRVMDRNGGETQIYATQNGKAILYYDNSNKIETTSTGCKITGGHGDGLDIENGGTTIGAQLKLKNTTVTKQYTFGVAGNDGGVGQNSSLVFRDQTAGTTRLELNTSGHLLPGQNNTYNLGSTSRRWANIYTNDLNLSNEGSSNDVDGTWGDWTIQEGESDLFLKNNRSGKKYKFNLMEVT